MSDTESTATLLRRVEALEKQLWQTNELNRRILALEAEMRIRSAVEALPPETQSVRPAPGLATGDVLWSALDPRTQSCMIVALAEERLGANADRADRTALVAEYERARIDLTTGKVPLRRGGVR